MRLITESTLRAGWFASMVDTKHDLTVMVKGTYRLVPDGTAIPVDEETQLLFTGDEYVDEEKPSSLRYEMDCVPFKPKADLLLVGKCYAPGGKPTTQCLVKLLVGSQERTLAVIGDRKWKTGLLNQPGEPRPFTEMPIVYERAFGGVEYSENPLGIGAGKNAVRMPNIEDANNLVRKPNKKYPVAGLGPLHRSWGYRRSKTGTYDASWLASRWPRFPKDFDWTYFNAAPPELQVAGYFKGDEPLYLWNLHAQHEHYRCKLPGVRPRTFVRTTPSMGGDLREVKLRLDTVWIDAEAESLVLVWRGVTPVRSWDFAELDLLFLAEERCDKPARSLLNYASRLARLLAATTPKPSEHPRGFRERHSEPSVDDDATMLWSKSMLELTRFGERDDELEPSHSDMPTAMQFELDIDDDHSPSVLELPLYTALVPHEDGISEEEATLLINPKVFEEHDGESTFISGPPSFSDLMAVIAEAEAAETRPAIVPEPEPEPEEEEDDESSEDRVRELIKEAKEKLKRELEGKYPPAAFAAIEKGDFGEFVNVILIAEGREPVDPELVAKEQREKLRQQLEEAGADPEVLAIFDGPESQDKQPETEEATLTREDVEHRLRSGLSLRNQNCGGLDLSKLDFKNVDLTGIKLHGSDLSQCSLEGALLVGAHLVDTNLSGACLDRANLTKAYLEKSNLTEATLKEALMGEANFTKANLDSVDLSGAFLAKATFTEAHLTRATLDDADFTDSVLEKADLSQSSLSAAIFDGADLRRAKLEKVRAGGASFRLAKLQLASFVEGDFCEADFSMSRLEQAKFDDALLHRTRFSEASGENVSFARADLTEVRASESCSFPKARLTWIKGADSQWAACDLREASFCFADLPRASFVGSDLRKADMHAADLRAANLSKANLGRAKLTQVDLFQGRLERADLTRTNLSGACCFQAEFLDAIVDRTLLDGANLKGSKLASLKGRR